MTNDLVEKYKHIPFDCLIGYNLLEPARKSGYVCPDCGNGLGSDGTGMEFQLVNDGYKAYCHKCGSYFDVFDLIARRFHLDVKSQFGEVLQEARAIFGDEPKKMKVSKTAKPAPKLKSDFRPLIEGSWKNLEFFFSTRKNWRGLTYETLKKFGCGYIENWSDGTERIIIPTSFHHYLARLLGETDDPNIKVKPHRGTKDVFGLKAALGELEKNADLLVFAVEGEIDAMSIWQSGFVAIAFSGSSITENQQNQLKKFPAGTRFLIMFDNDDTGRLKAPKAEEVFRGAGFKTCALFLNEKFDDFNAWLQADPNGLKNELTSIFKQSVESFQQSVEKVEENPPDNSENGVEELAALSKGITTQAMISSCPIDLKIPKIYDFSADSIKLKFFNKDGEEILGKARLITHTPVVPVRILESPSGSDVTVELAILIKNTWHIKRALQADLATSRDIVKLAGEGLSVTSGRAADLSNFLVDIQFCGRNPFRIPRAVLYDQTGWRGENCEDFIYPPEGDGYVMKDNGFNYAGKFGKRGDVSDWLELFADAYENSVGARYAIGLACAAPLLRICNVRNLQGVLIAQSGSGKSAVAKLATSIFGNPDKLHETLNATGKGVDEISPRYNDLFCWVDEFQSADANLKANVQTMIFNYAEGKTRLRLNRNAEIKKQYEFYGTRLITSEEDLLQDNFTQGAHNRVIEFKADGIIDDELAVKIHQNINKSFGHFGKSYTEYVNSNYYAVRETYKEIFDELKDFGDFVPAHRQHLALVYTGLTYFCKMLEDAGDMDFKNEYDNEGTHQPYLLATTYDWPFFGDILPTPEESSNVVRALNTLAEMLQTHDKYFKHEYLNGNKEKDYYDANLAPTIGVKLLEGEVVLYPQAFSQAWKKLEMPPVSTVMRELAARGLLKCSGSSRKFKTKYKGNWVYFISRDAFK